MTDLVLGRTRAGRVGRIVLLLALATGGTAYATTGYTANPRSVTFYYGETGGNGDSDDFDGYGSVSICMNDQGGPSNREYTGTYYRNRTLSPDSIVYSATVDYTFPEYQAPVGSTSSGNRYHVNAWWQGVPSAPDGRKGYVASRTAGYSCVWP